MKLTTYVTVEIQQLPVMATTDNLPLGLVLIFTITLDLQFSYQDPMVHARDMLLP